MLERPVVAITRPATELRHTAQVVVVGIEILGGLAPDTLDFGLLDLRRDRGDHVGGDPVLQREDVLEITVKAVGLECAPLAASMSRPVIRSRWTGLSHAALKDVAHAQLAADGLMSTAEPL